MMKKDNEKKDWFLFSTGTFFNNKPKNEGEREYFEAVKKDAIKYGVKVIEVHFNKTEEEFFNRK